MNLPELVRQNLAAGESGLLSIKIEGESFLLKIWFGAGEILSLGLGMLKNGDCIGKLADAAVVEHFFVKGCRPPSAPALPLTAEVSRALGLDGEKPAGAAKRVSPAEKSISPETLKTVEEDFIGLIGPIGGILADEAFAKVSCRRGAPMSSDAYASWLEHLSAELPEAGRAAFAAGHGGRG